MYLIDTDIAIHLRDGTTDVKRRIGALPALPSLSMLSLVELEGGITTVPQFARERRIGVDALAGSLELLPFDRDVVRSYGTIVATCGFSRPRILDRLIAATAIVHDLTLVTINGDDFRDIPGLKLDVWPAPQ